MFDNFQLFADNIKQKLDFTFEHLLISNHSRIKYIPIYNYTTNNFECNYSEKYKFFDFLYKFDYKIIWCKHYLQEIYYYSIKYKNNFKMYLNYILYNYQQNSYFEYI